MSPEWLHLKVRIEQFVTLRSEPLELGGQRLDWYRVTDGERLLSSAVQGTHSAEELDPFWAATWRAAVGLDRFMSRYELRDVRVLELGCGSGQAGVGAALRGARVTLTDAVGIALLVARLNAWPVKERVQIRRLKWDSATLIEPRFPHIIGSDLVYDPSHFPLLERCARLHLSPGGRLLLSEPHRHTGDHFARWIAQAGWQTIEHDVDLADGRIPIRVFECELLQT
ncbi:MAG: SAM-dependent methyltransferase [Pirellulaceae bacterium]|jgi:predicted nicotinamide N-methyase|nr:SAM-dependent methyltransferase [Pirellulaceae bacterium]